MQRRASGFTGYTIEATDGKVGAISDILFEDQSWKLRWFVVDTGSWLARRKILIHPASLERPDMLRRAFPTSLTKLKVEESPDVRSDQPVSHQLDQAFSDYYGCSSMWGDQYGIGPGISLFGDGMEGHRSRSTFAAQDRDERQLLSVTETVGFRICALDGDIGHLDDFLVSDETWTIEFAVVATSNWGAGKHVLVSPKDVKATDVLARCVPINLTRYNIRCSPSWQEPDLADL